MRRTPFVLTLLLLAAPALAQMPGGAPAAGASGPQHVRLSEIIGTNIRNDRQEVVGNVNDFVVDPSNRIVALVVGVGGVLGMGEKNVALPIEQVRIMPQPNGTVVVFANVDKAALVATQPMPSGPSLRERIGTAAQGASQRVETIIEGAGQRLDSAVQGARNAINAARGHGQPVPGPATAPPGAAPPAAPMGAAPAAGPAPAYPYPQPGPAHAGAPYPGQGYAQMPGQGAPPVHGGQMPAQAQPQAQGQPQPYGYAPQGMPQGWAYPPAGGGYGAPPYAPR